MAAAKGAAGGYFPLGLAVASGNVYETINAGGGFVHGFTYSHSPVGAAVASEVLRILESERLVEASAVKESGSSPSLASGSAATQRGEVRGRGLLVGVELVADRSPNDRSRGRPPDRGRDAHALDSGLLMYHGTGNADGTNGDTVLLGPPFVVTDDELKSIAARLGDAVDRAAAEASGRLG